MRYPSRRFTRVAASLTLAFVAAACSEQALVQPESEALDRAPLLSSAMDAGTTAQHVVTFKKSPSADFESEVANRGGTVLFSHDIGFALVSGLDDAAAAEIGGLKGVTDVMADESFTLDDPATMDVATGSLASPDDPT